MRIRVLGSAAGGGFPQWNCNCHNCRGYREGRIDAEARTQSSITLSGDGEHWLLCNASPDIRTQLASFAPLQPARQLRDTGISAILLMDAQIDHTSGLLMLREGCPRDVYCSDPVYDDLSTGFPIFPMLTKWNGGFNRHRVAIDGAAFAVPALPQLQITALPLSSQPPPYSPRRGQPAPGDNIGIFVEDQQSGGSLFYAPGLGAIEPHLLPWMERADCLLVDGTLWCDDEMIRNEVGTQTGLSMGHLPQSGPGGMIELLDRWPEKRRILIHINNTNPILDNRSPERAALSRRGIEVAHDGLEIEL